MIGKEKLIEELDNSLEFAKRAKRREDYCDLGILIKKDDESNDEAKRVIEEWVSNNNLNLEVWECKRMTDNEVKGKLVANQDGKTCSRVYPTIFDELDKENTVLLIENFDLAPKLVRQQVKHIIKREYVEHGKVRNFDNLLFVVATVNPDGTEGRKKLDASELCAFVHLR